MSCIGKRAAVRNRVGVNLDLNVFGAVHVS